VADVGAVFLKIEDCFLALSVRSHHAYRRSPSGVVKNTSSTSTFSGGATEAPLDWNIIIVLGGSKCGAACANQAATGNHFWHGWLLLSMIVGFQR
jgi:hypothetical protein